jgi:replicative DNA helicase
MEQQSSKLLSYRKMADVTNESVAYIKARKEHTVTPLRTGFNKLNKVCGGGIEPNMIVTIAGRTGSGKSALVNAIETDLIDLNDNVVVLNFSFEMLSYRNVTRKLSTRLSKTTTELYSAVEDLDDGTFKKVQQEAAVLADYPIYYIDTPGTVTQIKDTILHFYDTVARGKRMIVILDHTLLVEGDAFGDTERKVLVDLQKMFIFIKKLSGVSIIQISQMNRNIEDKERIINPALHFPLPSDLASSDAIFQASDYVMVLSRPELLNIRDYGVQRLITTDMVYLHILKVRDGGEPCILQFENELKYNTLREI